MTAARDLLTFVSSAVRSPAVIGAVAPSGRALCDLLASVAPQDGSATVVELGPGTGVVSQALRRRLAPEARHVAVEIDPGMVTHLTRTRPWLEVVHGDAKDLQKLLADIGITSVDTVVSGLPWTLFSREAQRGIMEQVSRVLVPGGVFTTFAYRHVKNLPTQRRFRELLEQSFDEVRVTPTVWRNVPPALAYQCRNLADDVSRGGGQAPWGAATRRGPREAASRSAGSVASQNAVSSSAKRIGSSQCGKCPESSKTSSRLPGHERRRAVGVADGDDRVAATPDDEGGQALGQVEPVGPGDPLAPRPDDAADRVDERVGVRALGQRPRVPGVLAQRDPVGRAQRERGGRVQRRDAEAEHPGAREDRHDDAGAGQRGQPQRRADPAAQPARGDQHEP